MPSLPSEVVPATAAEDFDPAQRVGHLLRRAYHRAKNNTSTALKPLGVTPMQAAALMALAARGAISQAELGRAIGMEPANVHTLLVRLTKLRLVTLTPHVSDNRQILVDLSAEGSARAQRIAGVTRQASARTLQPLQPDEQRVLLALLRRLTDEGD